MFPFEVLRTQDDLNRWLSMQIETIEAMWRMRALVYTEFDGLGIA